MKLYVVYGVDQVDFYPSGHAEVHYVGNDLIEATTVSKAERERNIESWKINIEVWENGVKIETIQEEI